MVFGSVVVSPVLKVKYSFISCDVQSGLIAILNLRSVTQGRGQSLKCWAEAGADRAVAKLDINILGLSHQAVESDINFSPNRSLHPTGGIC